MYHKCDIHFDSYLTAGAVGHLINTQIKIQTSLPGSVGSSWNTNFDGVLYLDPKTSHVTLKNTRPEL
mgnify:CR=1 FL=1